MIYAPENPTNPYQKKQFQPTGAPVGYGQPTAGSPAQQPGSAYRPPAADQRPQGQPFSSPYAGGAAAGQIAQPSGPPPVDTEAVARALDPNAKTDGYAAPQFTPGTVGGVMPGWDQTKWADTAHQTPKYAVGRILSNYAPTVQGLGQAMAEIQKAYPGASWNGKDKVTLFPGQAPVDVLQGASNGGVAWQWLDETAGGGSPQSSAVTRALGGGSPQGLTPGGYRGSFDILNQILASLRQNPVAGYRPKGL